jgi:hypothetical protein
MCSPVCSTDLTSQFFPTDVISPFCPTDVISYRHFVELISYPNFVQLISHRHFIQMISYPHFVQMISYPHFVQMVSYSHFVQLISYSSSWHAIICTSEISYRFPSQIYESLKLGTNVTGLAWRDYTVCVQSSNRFNRIGSSRDCHWRYNLRIEAKAM